MAWLIAIVLAPILFALVSLYTILKLTALLLRIVFAPVVWLNGRQTRQRVELYHYDLREGGK
jgi:hypothetical protein